MVPPAAGADGAGYERSVGFTIHGFYNLTHQTATDLLRTPVTTTGFGAVTGKPKPFFGLANLLPSGINESLVNNDRLIKVLNMASSILNTEKGSTGLSSRTGAE